MTPDAQTTIGADTPSQNDVPKARANILRRRRTGSRLLDGLIPLAVMVAVLALWEIAVRLFTIEPFLLPAPSAIIAEIINDHAVILPAALTTMREFLLGYIISAVIAISLGAMLAASRLADKVLMPLIVGTNAIPMVAVAPLLLIWFGTGNLSKIILVVLMTFFPILITTATGLREVEANYIRQFKSVGASSWQEVVRLRIPYAIPHIFSGLKLATTFSVIAALIAEWLSSSSGLGYLLILGTNSFRTPLVFACIFFVIAMSLTFYGLMHRLGMRLSWTTADTSDQTSFTQGRNSNVD